MLRILDRYLLKEVIANWLAVMLVLWAIVLSNRLVRYLGEAASGDLGGSVIFTLLGLKSINYLTTLMPLSLYLGVLLALGRFYKDSEMAAMAACGVGYRELYRPLLGLALVVGAVLMVLSLYVAPETAQLSYRIQAEAKRTATIEGVSSGRFQEARGGQLVFYAREVSEDGDYLKDVFVRNLQTDPPMLITARRAYPARDAASGARFLVLEDGYRYQGFPGDPVFRVMKFDKHGIRIEAPDVVDVEVKHDAIPTRQLLGSSQSDDIAELQWRISLPVAAVVLMVLAVPLSRTTPRQGRYAKLFMGILVFIIYYNLLGTAQVWVEKGQLPAVPGLWWVHLVPLAIATWLWRRDLPRAPHARAVT